MMRFRALLWLLLVGLMAYLLQTDADAIYVGLVAWSGGVISYALLLDIYGLEQITG